MERSELRPYAAAGVALLGTGLVAAAVSMSSPPPAIQVQSPAVENTAAADGFAVLANAFDATASSDGLLALANSLDSDLDLLGTPTVNVADTLATDFVGLLDVGNSLGTIDGDINSGFALLDSDLSALITP